MYKFNIDIKPANEIDELGRLKYLIMKLVIAGKTVELVSLVLENIEQLSWFIENEEAIRYTRCPLDIENSCSIAEGINLLYDKLDYDSDVLDKLYMFRSQHALRFAFRGQDIPDIFIALNNDQYEVSCSDENCKCHYVVDIDSLFHEVRKLIEYNK
ncbi:hypothetical protein [Vibrio gazogenes]|uniref:Uncharacterized protein n=1 Tax=Vibrio gazogenes TaxID=687 RepID=A0A1Z2SL83_VIBGA|nr:hypothetical protein [Vibrio gazogenes]ASA57896.1 hypothetical protein BSQ33_19480 [Vibrio gazogenes]